MIANINFVPLTSSQHICFVNVLSCLVPFCFVYLFVRLLFSLNYKTWIKVYRSRSSELMLPKF